MKGSDGAKKKSNLFSVLKPYTGSVSVLLLLTLLSNAITLVIPKIIQQGIDDYTAGNYNLQKIILWFVLAAAFIFVLSYLQSVFQTYISEKVARHLRSKLTEKIAAQDYNYIRTQTTSKLLTNITSDTNAVKMFISQAVVSLISSAVLIVGTAILLLSINLRLGLIVLIIVPLIITTFMIVFKKVRVLFKKSQEVVDWLNKVINESILGAALIRVLNAQSFEYDKFIDASGEAKNLGLKIVRLFSLLIPVIVFTASMAQLAVVGLGGHYIILGNMTLGEFAAFNGYIAILIFPLIVIGFTSGIIARASASYQRICHILDAPDPVESGTYTNKISGNIELTNISFKSGENQILKDISFSVTSGSRTAIIGPTAAGKTQLLNIIIGLLKPSSGEIYFDGIESGKYRRDSLLNQISIVFQDSIIFNLDLKENISFSKDAKDEEVKKAIETAELGNFIDSLPEKMQTMISERGTSLSGGQKQRIMLARALAINPTILLLDDFTARVDAATEKKIGKNLIENYPGITLLSVTQKIEPIKEYDQIILLMEGEIIGKGTHDELCISCPEYVQIYNSQQSMNDVVTQTEEV